MIEMLLQAERALTLGMVDQAERLLQRVLRDFPKTEWAKAAQERLDGLRKGAIP